MAMEIRDLLRFVGRATVVHFATYFAFGLLFFTIPGYGAVYSNPEVSPMIRPTTDPLAMAGPFLQLARGPILALALFPFRSVFVEQRRGWIALWGLFLGLAILGPAVAAPGSFEGLIYTKLPLWFHLFVLPEVILQTLAFSWLFVWWQRLKMPSPIPAPWTP